MFAYDFTTATDQETEAARQASAKINPFLQQPESATLQVTGASVKLPIVLPPRVLPLLKEILEALAAGHGVTIVPQHAELTTMEAADILNVSRPYLVKLLESGEIPFRKVGQHRRVLMEDIMTFKEQLYRKRSAILDQMVAEAEELGLYD